VSLLVIDFETYYTKKFGFNKLTTEEYIRHKKFEVVGVAVKRDNQETVWFSGTRKNTQAFLDQFDWANSTVVAHNAKFDVAILNWLFNKIPLKIVDTLSMARAIHTIEVGGSLAELSKFYKLGVKGDEVHDAIGKQRLDFSRLEMVSYGKYCIQDVDLTYKLYRKLIKNFPPFELDLIDLTIRMFSEPALVLDVPVLEDHLKEIHETKKQLLAKIVHDEKDLRSNDKFAELLKQLNVNPPKKISVATGKETYAFAKTDEQFRDLLEHENEYVRLLVAARLGVKSTIEETRTQRFVDMATRGPMPIPLRYYAAHTGRWGGEDKINMQNLPRGSKLKYALCAPEGYMFIDCDLSQIEARTLAWLAEADDLVKAFDRGDDVYKIMASAIYNKPEQEVTKEERFVGKQTVLGCGYGMGANKFQMQLKNFGVELEIEECNRIIKVYRETYEKVPQLWKQANSALKNMLLDQSTPVGRKGALLVLGKAGIQLPNGLCVKYPNLRELQPEDEPYPEMVYETRKGKTTLDNRIYGGKVIENVCQALARIVIGEQLLRVSKKYKVVMTVHDAIGCIAPDNEVEEAMKFVENCMRVRPTWALDLPLDCEGGYAKNYGNC